MLVLTGFAKSRLMRLHDVMARHVESGTLPGAVTVLARHGEVHVHTVGAMSLGGPEIRRDAIFRISSMTKPIIATAAMILVEECLIRLDDPVDGLLPELAGRRVLRRPEGPIDDTVPANRPLSLRDLLTFRMGLGILFGPPETNPLHEKIRELGIAGFGPPSPGTPDSPDQWLAKLGTLPLLCQPGERWHYNVGAEVLGVLIARASGMPLEEFLRERIFAPLGMPDTAFSVPETELGRLVTEYAADPVTGELTLNDDPADSPWARPPVFPSGGAGLVSTADDFLAFGRMLLNNGEHVLSRPSVRLMTTDHLTPEQKAVSQLVPGYWATHGWGFGMAVVTARDSLSATPGGYGWDGGLGTAWFNDPAEEMVGILLTQRMAFPLYSPVYQDFWTSAYAALDG